jgi:hypothetical protein
MRTASTDPRASARSILRLAIGLSLLGASILLPAPPASADCSILDLSCVTQTVEEVVQTTTQTAGGVVQTVEETVEQPIEGVEETVEETVGGVEETVEETVETVEETVDGVIGSVEEPIEETVGAVADPVASLGPGAPSREAGGGAPPGGPDRVGAREVATVSPLPGSASGPLATPVPTQAAPSNGVARAVTREQIGRGLGPAEVLAFPLALTAIVGAFLLVQMRLDRRDPKLALAPVGADVLSFV